MITRSFTKLALLGMLMVAGLQPAYAQDEAMSAEEQEYLEQMQAVMDSLDPQNGEISLGDDLVTLQVPDEFYFLGAADAETVLVEIWGNPPGQDVMGMLFPAQYTPFDYESWAVTIEYVDDGHVSDEDAADIDYAELLEDMQSDSRDSNDDRIDAGYQPVELVGWAEQPHYDTYARKLYWAKELQFGEDDETTLNYDIRALGRTGVLSMTFIANTSQLAEVNASRDAVLAMAEFNPGNRYEDFDSSMDHVAAYGIGALVAGKVAMKTGMLAAFAVLAKKFGVILFIGLAAFGRKIKSMFQSDSLTPP